MEDAAISYGFESLALDDSFVCTCLEAAPLYYTILHICLDFLRPELLLWFILLEIRAMNDMKTYANVQKQLPACILLQSFIHISSRLSGDEASVYMLLAFRVF